MSRHRFQATAAPPPDFDLNPRRDAALHFPARAFGRLSPSDYDEIGFMCGLEVHQQLHTKSKLFCRCPAGWNTRRVDAEVLRHMRPTLSELGYYDGCALMEFKTRKEIVYQLDRRCVCTYEVDDTPPFEIDEEAVRTSIEIARLFDMALVSELQVMRKQYLDGSIPTGFQRTAMIAIGGSIPFSQSELGGDRQIRIRQLTLEEDSCREISDVGHRIVFRADRLGMPLTEVVTEPDFLTPHDVAAGGRLLARVARASGKVRRGAGSARQDVNVSVAGGRRVEIKGVSSHLALPRMVHIEAFRQLELLRIKAELESRGVQQEWFEPLRGDKAWPSELVAEVQDAVRKTAYQPLCDALERGECVAAVRLPRFAGLLTRQTQPRVTFAQEFAERLRVIACLTSRPFMAISDGDAGGVESWVWSRVRAALSADEDDCMVLLWGSEDDVDTGAREIVLRAREALDGVPSETRQSRMDGTTGLERILPGPERMYPDTDTPPIPIPDEWITEVNSRLAPRPWEREARYAELGLDVGHTARLLDAERGDLFDELNPRTAATARRLENALTARLVYHRRQNGGRLLPASARLAPLVAAVDDGRVRPEAFEMIFDAIVTDQDADVDTVIASRSPRDDDDALLSASVAAAVERRGAMRPLPPDAAVRWAMGEVMPEFLGRLAPDVVRAALTDALASGVEEQR